MSEPNMKPVGKTLSQEGKLIEVLECTECKARSTRDIKFCPYCKGDENG